ncbi:MAG: HDIG domain-containing protein [Pirellulaceae bacterium]
MQHAVAVFFLCKLGMYAALYVLCGVYIYYRRRAVLQDLTGLSRLILLVTVTVAATWFSLKTRFELVPLLLFAMTAVIVYQQEIALLLSASVALVAVLSGGLGILELVTLSAAMSVVVLMIRHIRTRTKLIYVGLWTAAAVISTTIGVGTFLGRNPSFILLQEAAWYAACAVGAGVLMTGLLPFVEKFFDVQTDLSLLELGDVAHPLLQELVRRAPGTYNHSINVASIAQAAAESIGANGLLVRVGAYFHDIGKMLKPQYFVENQSGDNRHESLMPAMSTLVIIAHVKDGADLARQHNLPNTLVDFILQHHGTTLVEYFYHRANEKQRESDPDAELVDEGHYRYPGPKPQTKEAAVLMLADAVKRVPVVRWLIPRPARIESLVEDMAMKKLMDGQFDECGLTLKELRTIQDSLIKSLTAVYHGRIKYPDQQTA